MTLNFRSDHHTFSLLCPGEKESLLKSFLSTSEGQIHSLLLVMTFDLWKLIFVSGHLS